MLNVLLLATGSREVAVNELGVPVAANATGVTFGTPPPPASRPPAPAPSAALASGITSNLNLTGVNATQANFNDPAFRQRYADILANVSIL